MRLRWTALILLLIAVPAVAQQANQYWRSGSGVNPFAPVSTTNPLPVNVVTGGGTGGTSSTFGAAFPGTGTAVGFTDGTNMIAGTVDGSGNLKVNCATGCAGGTFNNNADNIATSSTNGQSAAWLYVWDGAAWDRLYGDSTNGAKVQVTNTNANGQATMANSSPVVIASNQSAISTTFTNTTIAVTNAGTFAVQSAATLAAETTKVIGTVRVSAMAAAARNVPGCTVGTSSAQCLAAAQAVNFLQIQNTNATSTNNIACNIVGGTAVLNSATSIQLAPGQSASWGPNTGGVPSGAINCIATSASSPLYVEWN